MASAAASGLSRKDLLVIPRRGFIITVFGSLYEELGVLVVADGYVDFTAEIGGGATESSGSSESCEIILIWVIRLGYSSLFSSTPERANQAEVSGFNEAFNDTTMDSRGASAATPKVLERAKSLGMPSPKP